MNDNVGPKIDPFGVQYKNLVLYSRDMFNVSSFQLDLTFVTVNYRLLYIFKYSCHAWHFPTCIFDLFFLCSLRYLLLMSILNSLSIPTQRNAEDSS